MGQLTRPLNTPVSSNLRDFFVQLDLAGVPCVNTATDKRETNPRTQSH